MRKFLLSSVAALALASGAQAADVKVSDLPAATSLGDSDLFAVVASGTTKKITVANTRASIVNDAELTCLAGLTSAADRVPYFTGSGTCALGTFTSAGRSVVAGADAAAIQTVLSLVPGTNVQAYDADLLALAGLTSAADKVPYFTGSGTASVTDFTSTGRSIVGAANAGAVRTTLSLVPGTDVQAQDAELSALAGLTSATDKLPYFTGAGTAGVTDFTSTARSLIDDTSTGAMRTTLGVAIGTNTEAWDADLDALAGLTSAADALPYFTGTGTAATTTLTSAARTVLDDTTTGAMRTTLGVAVGTDVQAQDAELAALAGLTSASDKLPYFTGSGTASLATFTAAGRALVDDADAGTQRATLGLVIATDVEAHDADLTALAAVSTTGGLARTGTATFVTTKRKVAACQAVPPATLGATYGVLSGTSTPAENYQVWDFDAATNWYVDLLCQMDGTLPASTGVDLKYCFAAASATSGDVIFDGSIRRMDSAIDLDTTAFTYTTAAQAKTTTTAATAGKTTCDTIGFTSGTNMNSAVAGDMITLRFWRDAAAGGDTMTGNARVLAQSFLLQEQ